METLFEDIKSQYVDDNGKTRMINYKNLSLMTSPLPPLDVPMDRTIIETSVKTALDFIKKKGLVLKSQDGNSEDGIQGFWVESAEGNNTGIYYGYIPVQVTPALDDVPFVESTQLDPLRTDETSELSNFRRVRKIADYLKQYVLYSYALNPTTDEQQGFDASWFTVIPDHTYEIEKLNKKLFVNDSQIGFNDVFYSKETSSETSSETSFPYLIVTSEQIRDDLMKYLHTELLNDTPGVLDMASKTMIQDYYQTVTDFRPSESQLIFMNKNGLLRWKKEHARSKDSLLVSSSLKPDESEPYFYRNPKIRKDALMVIQNIKDGLKENAIFVSHKWISDRVNVGYLGASNKIDAANISTTIYTDQGILSSKPKTKTDATASILHYGNEKYAAILFFN
jgi:hypothetical protein